METNEKTNSTVESLLRIINDYIHMKHKLVDKANTLNGTLGYLGYIGAELEWMRGKVTKGTDVSKNIQQVKREIGNVDHLLEVYIRR